VSVLLWLLDKLRAFVYFLGFRPEPGILYSPSRALVAAYTDTLRRRL
jgi:hypothetical protein